MVLQIDYVRQWGGGRSGRETGGEGVEDALEAGYILEKNVFAEMVDHPRRDQ